MSGVEFPAGKTPATLSELEVRGEIVVTRLYDGVTSQLRVDRADDHTLIAGDIIKEAIEAPNDMMWLHTTGSGHDRRTALVINGCNRRVDYHLVEYHSLAETWEARLIFDTLA